MFQGFVIAEVKSQGRRVVRKKFGALVLAM